MHSLNLQHVPDGTHTQLVQLRRKRDAVAARIDAAEATLEQLPAAERAPEQARLVVLQQELARLLRSIEQVGSCLNAPFPLAA